MAVIDAIADGMSAAGGRWQRGRGVAPLAVALAFLVAWAFAPGAHAAECSGAAGIASCQSELASHPKDFDLRMALADGLNGMKRHKEAVQVLEQGLALEPGNEELQHRLSLAKSLLEEQEWIQKKSATQRAAARAEAQDTATKLNIIRCTSLQGAAALSACDNGLEKLPNDVALLTGKGDALVELHRATEAVVAYRRALARSPHDAQLQRKLQSAEAKRQLIVARCMKRGGESGLAACKDALLKGEKDEGAIQARRGDILLAMKQREHALEAYRAARALDPRNRHVVDAIAALTEPPKVAVKKVPAHKQPPAPAKVATVTAPRVAPRVPAAEPAAGTPHNLAMADRSDTPAPPRYGNAPLAPGVTY